MARRTETAPSRNPQTKSLAPRLSRLTKSQPAQDRRHQAAPRTVSGRSLVARHPQGRRRPASCCGCGARSGCTSLAFRHDPLHARLYFAAVPLMPSVTRRRRPLQALLRAASWHRRKLAVVAAVATVLTGISATVPEGPAMITVVKAKSQLPGGAVLSATDLVLDPVMA